MNLPRLVPTMGLIAATTSGAMAFDLADGALHINGYVDAILELTQYEKNAPRSAAGYDNYSLWNEQTGLGAAAARVPGGGAGALLLVPPTVSHVPTWSYFGNGYDTNAATAYPGAQALLNVNPVLGAFQPYIYNTKGKACKKVDFATTAEISVGWDVVRDRLEAVVDVQMNDDNQLALEQAFIDWTLDTQGISKLQVGKFEPWIGLEAKDPTDMYRVNTSTLSRMSGTRPVDGAKASVNLVDGKKDDGKQNKLTVSLNLVDSIYGDPLAVKDSDDLGFGFEAKVTLANLEAGGSINIDHNATVKESAWKAARSLVVADWAFNTGGAALITALAGTNILPQFIMQQAGRFHDDVIGFNAWATFDPDGESSKGLFFGADLHYVDYALASAWGLMGMANYSLPEGTGPCPMGLTGMLTYYVPNTEDGEVVTTLVPVTNLFQYAAFNGEDAEEIELAVALLTNPLAQAGGQFGRKFCVNTELRYTHRKDIELEGSLQTGRDFEERSDIGIFVELFAIIP